MVVGLLAKEINITNNTNNINSNFATDLNSSPSNKEAAENVVFTTKINLLLLICLMLLMLLLYKIDKSKN